MFLLWNKETLKNSIKDYNKRIENNEWSIELKNHYYFFIIEYYIMNNIYKIRERVER